MQGRRIDEEECNGLGLVAVRILGKVSRIDAKEIFDLYSKARFFINFSVHSIFG
jgi:hypothetical protein